MIEEKFIRVDNKNGVVTVKINPKIFPIDLVYGAAYAIIDRAYVILDGDPNEIIYAILRPRTFKGELDELGRMFYDELLNFAFYTVQSIRNKEVREALLRAVFSEEEEKAEDIATIWEEKFGGKLNESSES